MAFCMNSPFLLPFFCNGKYRHLFEITARHAIDSGNPWVAMVDLVFEDAPQLFIPMYQAINFNVTPLVAFTLAGSAAMTLITFGTVCIGLTNNIQDQAEGLDDVLAALERGTEPGGEAMATVPIGSVVTSSLGESGLEGRVSKLELLLAQKDQRINHLEEKVEKLVHKLESAITPALTLLVKRARREGSTELATIG
jgi:hypothetical protein